MKIILMVNKKEMEFSILAYERKLRLLIGELEFEEKSPEVNELLRKALMEQRNLLLFITGVVPVDYYKAELETKDFLNYDDTKTFLKGNDHQEYPMLYMFYVLGLSFEKILTCIGKTKADIVLEMRINGFTGDAKNVKETILTTMNFHDYNKIGFYELDSDIAEEFARALLAKRVFRSKISMVLNMPFSRIDRLN